MKNHPFVNIKNTNLDLVLPLIRLCFNHFQFIPRKSSRGVRQLYQDLLFLQSEGIDVHYNLKSINSTVWRESVICSDPDHPYAYLTIWHDMGFKNAMHLHSYFNKSFPALTPKNDVLQLLQTQVKEDFLSESFIERFYSKLETFITYFIPTHYIQHCTTHQDSLQIDLVNAENKDRIMILTRTTQEVINSENRSIPLESQQTHPIFIKRFIH